MKDQYSLVVLKIVIQQRMDLIVVLLKIISIQLDVRRFVETANELDLKIVMTSLMMILVARKDVSQDFMSNGIVLTLKTLTNQQSVKLFVGMAKSCLLKFVILDLLKIKFWQEDALIATNLINDSHAQEEISITQLCVLKFQFYQVFKWQNLQLKQLRFQVQLWVLWMALDLFLK